MNLGEYYKNRNITPEGLYGKAKTDFLSHTIITSGPSKENVQKLENFLNNVVYTNDSKYDNLRSRVSSLVQQQYEKEFNITMDNLENNLTLNESVGYTGMNRMNNVDAIIRGLHDNSLAKNKTVSKIALEKRLEQVQMAIMKISENPNSNINIEQLPKIENDLVILESLLQGLLNEHFSYIQGGKQVLKIKNGSGIVTNENIYDRILQVDALYNGLSSVGSGIFTEQELGIIEETILGALSDDVNELSDAQAEMLLNEKLTGMQTRNEGSTKGLIHYRVGTNNPKIGKITGKGKNKSLTITDPVFPGGSFSFKYNSSLSPNSDVQGKMDVNFILGGQERLPFRISAKNWRSLNNRDFGSTQLAYAIIRSLDFDSLIDYLYLMQDEYIQLQQAHNFAKLCVLLDTVMGFSQKNLYADTLVINERGVKYHVYSIKEIIQNALDKDFKVNGYNNGYVHQNITNIRKAIIAKRGRSASFQYYSIKYAQSLMVSISGSTVNNLAS